MMNLTTRVGPLVLGLALAGSTGIALAGANPVIPPGGPAPKTLVGTWRTTLTRADIAGASNPAHMTSTWELVLVNGRYLGWPRALGLRPAGQGGDTVPFGFKANHLYVSCLAGGQGRVVSGYGTYAWVLRGGSLRFRLVSEPCKDRDLRNRIVILTSRPWTQVH
jgi:hypothetical protein